MWTSGRGVHCQRHPTFKLSISFARLNHPSRFERPWVQICTSKARIIDPGWGLAPCTAAAPQRLYTRATRLKLPDGQIKTSGTQNPLEASSNQEQELHILERAQAFGITTMDDLSRQCAFEDHSLHHTQLINSKPYSTNLELWCLLLDFQNVRFGESGVRKTWQLMKNKAGRVDEFFQGPISDHIWSALISAGLKTPSFLRQLCKHEMRLGAKRPSLYVDVVGSLLADNQPVTACRFSQDLQDSHPATSGDAYHLFIQACDSNNGNALENFLNVYKTFQKARIYSQAVPYLCRQERFSEAWKMHKFLLSRGDLPSEFESVKPLITYIVFTEGSFEEFLQDLHEHNIAYEAQARWVQEHEKSLQYGIASGTLNIVSSRTMGVQPSRLSDKFVARAFATKAFSFDLILHGLRLLGLREIGPLAMRQVSLSAGNPMEVCRRLELLKGLGVDHGSSMYARVVTSLATQGKATLLSDILASDQHPDVFEDLDLQEELLAQYYRNSDWRQVDRTLAILRVGNQEFLYDKRLSIQEASLNILLRSVVRVGDWSGIAKIMAQVRHRGCRLTTRTLRCMHNTILPQRRPGQRPRLNKGFDDVGFLLSLYQNAKNASIQIPPTFWREPIRRLGMLRRWNDLERMLFWLAARYSPRVGTSNDHASSYKRFIIVNAEHSLRRIFSIPLQRAVVEWAFQYPKPRHSLFQAPSTLDIEERRSNGTSVNLDRGVKVLRMLHDQYGVPIDAIDVRTACLQSLRKRFAPDYFLGRPVSYNIRHKFSAALLPEALTQLNAAWSGSLFDSKSTALHKHILRPRRLRGIRQRQRPYLRRFDSQTQDRRRQALQHTGLPRSDDDQGHTRGEFQSEFGPSQLAVNKSTDPAEEIVMYRDIYNVSLQDVQNKRPSPE
jgi:hypothetical protein